MCRNWFNAYDIVSVKEDATIKMFMRGAVIDACKNALHFRSQDSWCTEKKNIHTLINKPLLNCTQ